MKKFIKYISFTKKEELLRCLSRVNIISKDLAFNKITVTIEEDKFLIMSESEKGKINESMDCKATGEKIKFGINSRFLTDAVSRIKEDYLRIEIEKSVKPILIKRTDGEDYKCVILPLRLIG